MGKNLSSRVDEEEEEAWEKEKKRNCYAAATQ